MKIKKIILEAIREIETLDICWYYRTVNFLGVIMGCGYGFKQFFVF